jgi:hypothetical protein
MPPRKSDVDLPTHYYVTLIDAERNKVRFGPLTADEVADQQTQIGFLATGSLSIEDFLKGCGLWGGLEVRLVSDDGTDEQLAEIPWP